MLSHRLQIPGKALLCWAERQCHEGACSLLAPSPWGCCHHWLANPPKARNVFRHSLFPPQKQRSCSSRFFSKPQNKYYLFPIRLFTACLQAGQSKGTRESLGRSGQGWHCSRALTITDGPLIASTGFTGWHLTVTVLHDRFSTASPFGDVLENIKKFLSA